jgi:hypothetical protein
MASGGKRLRHTFCIAHACVTCACLQLGCLIVLSFCKFAHERMTASVWSRLVDQIVLSADALGEASVHSVFSDAFWLSRREPQRNDQIGDGVCNSRAHNPKNGVKSLTRRRMSDLIPPELPYLASSELRDDMLLRLHI